ncbi:MAG: sirohydrochlorin cobaltochelatase [Proteobacteria bacterium]|jgi:sirohydrochlorin cobaltochelatase|nr:sirohydrochlorin cobaltochelatase [Desulfocapsa sp.]MBU3943229.1 sirohydrochlorin cobaltochelatase [Pseudomonadota bacterium]MCG2742647.1 sirohydrochlorin cobaltochelatase [Desulfobacteraceae bacterium]MBU3982737.1 sirohydrochlorin cobaltochelatase [Pseudomonadota bacterium]MBU4030422.1 sirohydrochlorin cobaltochelatase [Pseudomonadota bacterium]
MHKCLKFSILWALCLLLIHSVVWAQAHNKKQMQAVVIAAFGTTVPEALPGILNIRERILQNYPNTEVRIAFTSNMIRAVWHKRQNDPNFVKKNPSVSQDILSVQGPLATIANLQDEGFTTILVQPTHVALGEEYLDLVSYVQGLTSIRTIKEKTQPFKQLVIGRPALGTMGDIHPYPQDIELVARALVADIYQAAKAGSALVYMGHGNDFFPSGGAYLQFADTMNRLNPQVNTYIGTVEGFPSLDHVVQQMKRDKVQKVLLKPFMTVAGDHARNDMAGPEAESWKSILISEGFEVTPVLQGMGEMDSFADVFVHHLADLAKDHGIQLD